MKRTYQIREWKAIEMFRPHLANDPGVLPILLPLAEIAELLRHGVSQLLHEAEKRLLLTIMDDEVARLTGDRYARRPGRKLRRWGRTHGSVAVHARKFPIPGHGFAANVGRRSWAATSCSGRKRPCYDRSGIASCVG
jgi:hypothetical protein